MAEENKPSSLIQKIIAEHKVPEKFHEALTTLIRDGEIIPGKAGQEFQRALDSNPALQGAVEAALSAQDEVLKKHQATSGKRTGPARG